MSAAQVKAPRAPAARPVDADELIAEDGHKDIAPDGAAGIVTTDPDVRQPIGGANSIKRSTDRLETNLDAPVPDAFGGNALYLQDDI